VPRISPITRISLGLVALTCSILVSLDLLGLLPAPDDGALEQRIQLCETLAAQTLPAIERNDLASVRAALQITVIRREDVLSAGLRSADGRLLLVIGEHRELWEPDRERREGATHVEIPLFKQGRRWGTIEVRFTRLTGGILASLWNRPILRLLGLVGLCGFVSYLFYMRRTLRHLDPSAVIPTRVQAALDVMAEGVMLVDQKERIILTNAVFAQRVEREPGVLMGRQASSLPWKIPDSSGPPRELPWIEAMRSGGKSIGTRLLLKTPSGVTRSFIVNGAPVLDGHEKSLGAIVTFDDVSDLERKTLELEQALVMVEKMNAELEQSNYDLEKSKAELQVLARRDPLTDVANRRYFMETYEARFEGARRNGRALACLMADIDHFKRVNDSYGHQMGDRVILSVAGALKAAVRGADAVCRYGGEEFCIVLTETSIEGAEAVAERIRARIESPGFAEVPVTVSLGVASIADGAKTLLALINQADEALYAAKQAGRNRVVRWDRRQAADG
jgi:diguanylate cyclase (GGDEF)-like protein